MVTGGGLKIVAAMLVPAAGGQRAGREVDRGSQVTPGTLPSFCALLRKCASLQKQGKGGVCVRRGAIVESVLQPHFISWLLKPGCWNINPPPQPVNDLVDPNPYFWRPI